MNQEDSLVQYLNPAVRSYLVNLAGEQDLQDLQYTYLELGYAEAELAPFQDKMMVFTKQELGRLAQTHTPTARMRLVRLCETLVQFYLLNQGGDAQQALAKINAFFPAGLRFSPHSGRLLFFPEQFGAHSELLSEASYALVNQMQGAGLGAVVPAPVISPTVETDDAAGEAYDDSEEDQADTFENSDDADTDEDDTTDELVLEDADDTEDTEAEDEAIDAEELILEDAEESDDFEEESSESEELSLEDAEDESDSDPFEATVSNEAPSLDDVLSDLGPPEEPAMEAGMEPEPEEVVEAKSAMDALAEVKNRRLKLLKKLQQTGS